MYQILDAYRARRIKVEWSGRKSTRIKHVHPERLRTICVHYITCSVCLEEGNVINRSERSFFFFPFYWSCHYTRVIVLSLIINLIWIPNTNCATKYLLIFVIFRNGWRKISLTVLFCFWKIFKYLYIAVINLRNWNCERYNEYTSRVLHYVMMCISGKSCSNLFLLTNWPTSEIEQNLEAKIKIAWIL